MSFRSKTATLLLVLIATSCLLPTALLRAEPTVSKKPFTVVLLPDTQYYSELFPATYVTQTLWIRNRLLKDNIKFAIHLGDIVQNPTVKVEWDRANQAMAILDDVVPYSVVPGNHDMVLTQRDSRVYNMYFPPARFTTQKWYGGHMGKTNDNNYCFFEAAGMKFMVISLEFAPRDETLEWAASVAKLHSKHRVIVATHCYMRNEKRDTTCATDYQLKGNSGEQMWQKLIRKQPNIFLVVSGHVRGVGLRVSKNDADGKVIQMLTDYQGLSNGGDGWLRTLKFIPADNKIQVTTYSPLLKKTNNKPEETFSIPYQMTSATSSP